jgi:dipeptidyl aminopeptidase/acylaminoacyl peptidase
MTKSLIFACVVVAGWIGSCMPATAPSNAPPSATPYPPLQTQGPYLLFMRDNKNLTIMDANGSGSKPILLPSDGYISPQRNSSFENVVSPDGKWLTYFTGSVREPYDLALHVLDLRDQTTFQVAKLITPGYPQNLAPVKTSDAVELEGCREEACRLNLMELAFREGIGSMAWSPDSQSLAFAGQIDGPSSDVYLYQIEDQSIRRLVSDLENVLHIDWAPNGERILYQNSTAGLTYLTAYIYVADPDQQIPQSPAVIDSGKLSHKHSWIAGNLYLIVHGVEGAPPQDLRSLNTGTQELQDLWPYTAGSFAIDAGDQAIVVSTIPGGYFNSAPDEGTYYIPIRGEIIKITEERFVLSNGFKESQVFGFRENQVYSILADGTITRIGPSKWSEYQPPAASPNQKWLILLENQSRITLYSAETYEQIKVWEIDERIYRVSWRPDSLGLFLLTDRYLYYLSIPDGSPVRLQDCSPNRRCPNIDFVWLPKK